MFTWWFQKQELLLRVLISLLPFYDIFAFTGATVLYSGVQKEEETHRCWIPSTVSSLSCRSSGFRSSVSSNKLPSNSTHAGTSPLDLHIQIHTYCTRACRHMDRQKPVYPFTGASAGPCIISNTIFIRKKCRAGLACDFFSKATYK